MTAGLLGHRLGHSLSPQIHRFFGDYDYSLFEREPGQVGDFLKRAFADEDFKFLNVTIPYKRAVAESCDRLTPLAERLGNVNFVRRDAEGRLLGDNTDYFGFLQLLKSAVGDLNRLPGRSAAVLGTGGAASTAAMALGDLGMEVSMVKRGEEPSAGAGLIVNATPVGMWPDVDSVRIDISRYPECRAVIDLVYNPSPTRFVREARAAGKASADGMVMLIAQAWRAAELSGAAFAHDGNLFLYGPPASGKSTWARRIAAAMERPLVDLDAEIVRERGCAIADVFARGGEAEFRRLERKMLSRVATRRGQVVALGGGALLDAESRRIAEASGRVAVLDCPETELLRRAELSEARPLLAGDRRARLLALLDGRKAHYRSFNTQVEFP